MRDDWREDLTFRKGRNEDRENYMSLSLTFIPEKLMEQLAILKAVLRHRKNRKVVHHKNSA